ncbi:aspartate/glutamate racemase family protein [Mycobacterium seoulense]|uniref:aspartate/glutamate racemase family protein n=1 Tax=Mycobacterium seoulense TaxID=386911 RepID=UPI003CF4BFB9
MDQLISPAPDRRARQRRLGVVDGLGPHATARFYAMLCEHHRALTGGSSPDVTVHTITVQRHLGRPASTGLSRPGRPEGLPQLVTRTSRSLAGGGADVIAVACNATTIDPAAGAPACIGMVEATARTLQRLNVRRVRLLASSIMVSTAAYERGLGQVGVAVVAPAPRDQEIIDRFIESLRRSRIPVPIPGEVLRAITGLADDVDALLLDCAELSGVLDAEIAGKPVIDSVRALVEHSCRALLDPGSEVAKPLAGTRPSSRWSLSGWRPYRPQRRAGELVRVGDIP